MIRVSGRGHRVRVRSGIAAVEFAVLLPMLIVLVVGIWELGMLIQVKDFVINAAREGGRQCAASVKTQAEVKEIVVRYLTINGIPATTGDVTITNTTSAARSDPADALNQDQYEVTVTIPINRTGMRWTTLDYVTPQDTVLTHTVTWISMRDVPVTVTPDPPEG